MINKIVWALCVTSLMVVSNAQAKVSSYVELDQPMLIEAEIDRVMFLAKTPVMKRPLATAQIKEAVNKVCSKQQVTVNCVFLKGWIEKKSQQAWSSSGRVKLKVVDGDVDFFDQNAKGERINSDWMIQLAASANISDYFAVSIGGQTWQDSARSFNPENSYLSLGNEWAQLDVGYKAHWWSPFRQSAMVISNNAPTFATVSVSNYKPLTDYNFHYELFVGEMSETNRILYQSEYVSGKPLLTGIHFSIEPFDGFSLGFNRLMQSGGGERDGHDFGDLLAAFFDPARADNTHDTLNKDQQFGNQLGSITAQMDFTEGVPMSIYMEYGGEDTSKRTNWRLGNSTMSLGLYMPNIWQSLDMRLEWNEWQNGWYVHSVYHDGLTQNGAIIGHWGANYRSDKGDGIGATSFDLMLRTYVNDRDLISLNFKQLDHHIYRGQRRYQQVNQLELGYEANWRSLIWQFDIAVGRHMTGEDYSSLTFGVRY